jgi:hypothetical protein
MENKRNTIAIVFILNLLIVGLFGCDQGTRNELPTVAPTALATPTLATEPTEPPTAQPTATQPPPTATVEPTPFPCEYPVQSDLVDAWDYLVLDCPIGPGAAAISTAYAPFEGGQMLWRGDTDTIYVLYNDGRWESYPNEWVQSSQEFSCGEESNPPTPVRGFGKVWCDHPEVREGLGAVTATEIGDHRSAVQDFDNGTILVAPFGDIFVFEGEANTWRMVDVPQP